MGPCVSQRSSWEAVGSPLDIWEEHMDYVWIRVVTPEWEYTQRVWEASQALAVAA